MQINEYQKLAARTINTELTGKDLLINGVMGLCGESGEAIDIVKKYLAQGHELDREKLIKELGDVAWYLAETATALDISLEDVMQLNIEKLKARYPEGFAAEKSLHRKAGDVIAMNKREEYIIGDGQAPAWCHNLLMPYLKQDGSIGYEFHGGERDFNLRRGDTLIKHKDGKIEFKRKVRDESKRLSEKGAKT